ncbi:hypothetical protein AMURIS_00915 [Acetatifactor muris]|uniref:Uncharacterized protein n=2 Tax=Acetatifactor muris TaxID=879566 RepID=A0A2K4ZCN2_9FIRM|nr:hypothetical protein AMURIS_00915 [Acetatifactor muris]
MITTGAFDNTSEYQLLIRLMKERAILQDDGKRRLRRKEEIEEPSKTLPNPSDPEATFRNKGGRKHIGYVGNVVEGVGEKGRLLKCIHGQVPLKCSYNPRMFKNTALKEISWKTVGRAKQVRYMQTEELRKYACFRNGVEIIPSVMRRKYHVDKIPAHGTKR